MRTLSAAAAYPSGTVSFSDYLRLAGITEPAYKSLRRRRQLPLLSVLDRRGGVVAAHIGAEPPPDSALVIEEKWWPPVAALAMIVANNLVDEFHIARDLATHIAAHTAFTMPRIAETKGQPVFIGYLATRPTQHSPLNDPRWLDPRLIIGTSAEITAAHGDGDGILTISVTAAIAVMRQRAVKAKIDLAAFLGGMP
jgi:hypothetical protein